MEHQRAADKSMEELKSRLVRMALVAEDMIDGVMRELIDRDKQVVRVIAAQEQDLNRLQIEIDEVVLRLLATQQPVASDLRFIVSAAKMNGELERIGDLAINISENAPLLIDQPDVKPLEDIPRMAQIARRMVRESVEAFVSGDTAKAQRVIMTDDSVDALKDRVHDDLLGFMRTDPSTIERALALILIARHLERIADHATNIAQDVIFMVQGRDVRHPRANPVR